MIILAVLSVAISLAVGECLLRYTKRQDKKRIEAYKNRKV